MLIFPLKKQWYEKIKSGEKTGEYREVKPYWKISWKQKILTWDRFNNPTPKKEPVKNYVTYTNNEKVDISECPF